MHALASLLVAQAALILAVLLANLALSIDVGVNTGTNRSNNDHMLCNQIQDPKCLSNRLRLGFRLKENVETKSWKPWPGYVSTKSSGGDDGPKKKESKLTELPEYFSSSPSPNRGPDWKTEGAGSPQPLTHPRNTL